MAVRVLLAGRVSIEVDGVPVDDSGLGRLGRLALAYLVVERHRPVARSQLAELLWGDEPPRTWDTAVRGLISRIRAVLAAAGLAPTEALTTAFGCYQLHLPPGTPVDVEAAAEALDRAVAELAAGRPGQALGAAEAAAAAAARQFLPGASGRWVEQRQAELSEIRVRALEAVADACTATGAFGDAVTAAEEAVALEPLRESAHLRLMAAHDAAGNRGEALRAYERCRSALVEELGVNPSPATEAAYVALLGEEPPAPAVSVDGRRDGPRHALPTPLTPLVGRDGDLARVKKLLSSSRLVTLTGTGGVGKSRLAVQAAADVAGDLDDGAALVELAPLADAGLLAQHLLTALGLHEDAGRSPDDTVVAYLRHRQVLLVLDNCEHLVSACAAVVESLLRSCPRLSVLTTSREPLGVPGETAWRVPSLSPVDAVRLFADRARSAGGEFVLTAANEATVAHLCQRLDGIPLALELAAARVGMLSVQEIAERLDDRFRLLSGGARTAAPRQQTLRATVDWTYDALSTAERALFNRLAVFASAFTLDAADHVGGGGAVLEVLSGLVNKSLVLAEADRAGRTRYRLLETMRHYARERLAESGDALAARAAHLRWATAMAQEAEPGLEGPEQRVWLDLLETEHDDLRAALTWATSGTDADAALRLAAALGRFWEVRGHLSEGRAWLESALAVAVTPGRSGALQAKVLNWMGIVAQRQGDYPAALEAYDRSLAIRRRLNDPLGIAASLCGLGNVAALRGDLDVARARYRECLAIGRELGEDQVVAAAVANLGWVADTAGDTAGARALYDEALAVRRRLGDVHGEAMALAALGDLAFKAAEFTAARALHTKSMELRRQLGDRSGVAGSLGTLGLLALHAGDHDAARAQFDESLRLRRHLGDLPGVPGALGNLADLARAEGDLATAETLVDQSLAVATELADRHCAAAALVRRGRLALATGDVDRAEGAYRDALSR
ncbi:MAG: tetratricopeptide repeat protein, partial [Actinomycetota bacterium]|nr:tetratricopeptide repeat protein [Actinomycetota bacterium]